jgi:hypothetical protein
MEVAPSDLGAAAALLRRSSALDVKTRQDRTTQDKTKQDKTRQTRRDTARQSKARQGKARQQDDMALHDKTRQPKTSLAPKTSLSFQYLQPCPSPFALGGPNG